MVTVRAPGSTTSKDVDVSFPLGCLIGGDRRVGLGQVDAPSTTFCCARWPSTLHLAKAARACTARSRAWASLDKVVDVDQAPIGRTPRSNPATYTGVFDHIRKLFAQTAEAKVRGYQPGGSRSTCGAGAARPVRATAP